MEGQKVRLPYFDALRGLAIMCVVSIHCAPVLSGSVGDSCATVLFRGLHDVAVPLFLALSGYFMTRRNKAADHRSFLRRQLPGIYIPMLLFSLPWLYLTYVTEIIWHVRVLNPEGIAVQLAKLFGGGFGTMYFVTVLIQFYLLLPWLQRLANGRGLAIAAAVTLLANIGSEWLQFFSGCDLLQVVHSGLFVNWLLFFVMGMCFARRRPDSGLLMPLALIAAGLAMQYAETVYISGCDVSPQFWLDYKTGSSVLAAGIIWLLFDQRTERCFRDNVLNRGLRYLGRMAFGIYLLNPLFAWVIVLYVPVLSDSWAGRWIFTMACCMAVVEIGRRIHRPMAERYLGFR